MSAHVLAADARGSGLHETRLRTMTERWLGFDWSEVLPWRIGDVDIELGRFEDIEAFLAEHGTTLVGGEPETRFLVEETTDAKRRFWAEGDVLVFRHHGRVVGYYGGHPSDWSSYYCRTMTTLPEYRESGLGGEVCRRIEETLAAKGVARIEVDTSNANVPMQRILLGLGFLITATTTSERWGTMLRFTRFVHEDAEETYRRQFVYSPKFGRGLRTRSEERRRR
jgi:RimJ/RimL family protein N-acetyltransferase